MRLAGANRAHHPANLVITDKGALATQSQASAGREKEHVAVAKQLFSAAFVKHYPAVGSAGHLEGDPGRQVALDQAGDDVDRRFLRSQNQMDTNRPALLGQPNDVLLDLLARGHHHVGDLVRDHHDERHSRRNGVGLFLAFRVDPLEQFRAAQGVVLREVPDAGSGQQGITLFHLVDRPGEDCLGLLHVGDDRVHQMRQRLVRC